MRIFISAIFTLGFVATCQASKPEIIDPNEVTTVTASPSNDWYETLFRSDAARRGAQASDSAFIPMAFTKALSIGQNSAFTPSKPLNLICTEVLSEDSQDGFLSTKKRPEREEEIKPVPLSPSKKGKPADQVVNLPAVRVLPAITLNALRDRKVDSIIAPNGTTVILVDLDRTLVQQKHLFMHLDEATKAATVASFYNNDCFEGSEEDFGFFQEYISATHQFLTPYSKQFVEDYVEADAPEYFAELHAKGAVIIGLTARKFLVADETDKSLRKLRFDFGKLSGLTGLTLSNGLFKLQNGVCYTGNAGRKVNAIPTILETIVHQLLNKQGPYNVYHWDDNDDEIGAFSPENPPKNLTAHPVTIQPFHYMAYELLIGPKVLSVMDGDHDPVHRELDDGFFYGGFRTWLMQEHGREVTPIEDLE
jgi:hypothetical protein